MRKPMIGIVGRTEKIMNKIDVIYLNEKLRKNIINKGGMPFLILPVQNTLFDGTNNNIPKLTEEEKNYLNSMIDLCDGIIMPGGSHLYEHDFYIYGYAVSKDIPILGICAGMQLMGIYDNLGEKLIKVDNETKHQNEDKYVHDIKIEKNSLLYRIINKELIKVNSKHTYCLPKVKSLKVSAISDDGTIEAIEKEDKKFVLGIQWHPEGMLDYDEDANKIIDAFMMAVKNK